MIQHPFHLIKFPQIDFFALRPAVKSPTSKQSTEPVAIPQKPQLLSRLTKTSHEYIYTVPNILTFTRLASAPLIGYFILTSQPTLALGLFIYAGITDAVDGWVARRFQQQTVVGTVIDPMADKALMTISVVALAVNGTIPPWLAVIILGRDVALSFAAFYFRWISLPPPKTMARYWDFSLPSAEVRPTEISKVNTFLQLLLVGGGLALPVVPEGVAAAWHLAQGFDAFQYLVATTTVWSGLSYIYAKDAVKILTQAEIEERLSEKEKENEKEGGHKPQ